MQMFYGFIEAVCSVLSSLGNFTSMEAKQDTMSGVCNRLSATLAMVTYCLIPRSSHMAFFSVAAAKKSCVGLKTWYLLPPPAVECPSYSNNQSCAVKLHSRHTQKYV